MRLNVYGLIHRVQGSERKRVEGSEVLFLLRSEGCEAKCIGAWDSPEGAAARTRCRSWRSYLAFVPEVSAPPRAESKTR